MRLDHLLSKEYIPSSLSTICVDRWWSLPVSALVSWSRSQARVTRALVTVTFRSLSRFEGALRARPHWSGPTVAAHSMRFRRCHRATGHGRWRQSHQGSSATPSPACRAGRCLLRTAQRTRASSSIVDVFVISKLLRANGECLGDYYRRRTWVAAKSHGELSTEL